MKKIALFGGSFNPPHIGHRQLIELVRDSFVCDEIWLLPSGDRADKLMHADSSHRIAMAEAFANELKKPDGPQIFISRIETDRKVLTQTIDTLRELKTQYPDHEFHFIISSELIPDIKGYWGEGEEIFNTTKFIIIERPGFHKLEEIELPPFHTVLTPLIPLQELSSTYLRQITDEAKLREVTGPEIAQYIIDNCLYGFNKA